MQLASKSKYALSLHLTHTPERDYAQFLDAWDYGLSLRQLPLVSTNPLKHYWHDYEGMSNDLQLGSILIHFLF